MTNSTLTMNPLDGGRKLVLLAVCVGLAAMLGASFLYRLSNPTLVQQGRQAAAQEEGEHSGEMEIVSALMQKVQQNPNDAGALFALGQHFLDHSDWARAEGFLARAVVASPADPQPLYMLGIAQYQQQSFEKAAETFERLIEIDPQPAARYNLGILYRHYMKAEAKGNAHLKAILDDPKAPEDLKAQARQELESAVHGDKKPQDKKQ
ncbi:tetratricopeptide repeat protein [Desulfovibrio oxamicus]|uniref:Tetratricopeptide repeat protein n=1 Tax=Nitratidesulfovibrio oxamicus TaxID=32016 RepID=A0ABS0J7I5_9BACT|nr:tetratricopeptide repeat protein [Nitratidesulfovibrio oxamicus]MBG3878425.1 tetratricopeptide repeat protein [Nitratidesulfovibrio oxamicus]